MGPGMDHLGHWPVRANSCRHTCMHTSIQAERIYMCAQGNTFTREQGHAGVGKGSVRTLRCKKQKCNANQCRHKGNLPAHVLVIDGGVQNQASKPPEFSHFSRVSLCILAPHRQTILYHWQPHLGSHLPTPVPTPTGKNPREGF